MTRAFAALKRMQEVCRAPRRDAGSRPWPRRRCARRATAPTFAKRVRAAARHPARDHRRATAKRSCPGARWRITSGWRTRAPWSPTSAAASLELIGAVDGLVEVDRVAAARRGPAHRGVPRRRADHAQGGRARCASTSGARSSKALPWRDWSQAVRDRLGRLVHQPRPDRRGPRAATSATRFTAPRSAPARSSRCWSGWRPRRPSSAPACPGSIRSAPTSSSPASRSPPKLLDAARCARADGQRVRPARRTAARDGRRPGAARPRRSAAA